MGIGNTAAKALLILRDIPEVDLNNTVFFGRQVDYTSNYLRRKIYKNKQNFSDISNKYADNLLEYLGFHSYKILDIADYEGASILHDLNEPIPQTLQKSFTNVIDIGTSEHIYDVSQSIRNIRDLCAPGGHVVMVSPANSWLGHGFYQFSPELFFRSFSDEYGFEVLHVFLVKELFFREKWFSLPDPKKVDQRGSILTKKKCQLIVIAKKKRNVAALPTPQQSDYINAWKNPDPSRLGKIFLSLPKSMRTVLAQTIIPIQMHYRYRLKPIQFKWKNGAYTFNKS